MRIAVDFDGTLVDHKYPQIGEEKPFAFEVLRKLQEDKHKLILWTSREGELLDDAVEFCRDRGVVFYAINAEAPAISATSGSVTFGRKIRADIYIDDRNLGGLPDWNEIYDMVNRHRRSHRKPKRESAWSKMVRRCREARTKFSQ